MELLQKQDGWEPIKIKGGFALVTSKENNRIFELFRKYKGYSNIPSGETFHFNGLKKNENDMYVCNEEDQRECKINELEFFLLPIIKK